MVRAGPGKLGHLLWSPYSKQGVHKLPMSAFWARLALSYLFVDRWMDDHYSGVKLGCHFMLVPIFIPTSYVV